MSSVEIAMRAGLGLAVASVAAAGCATAPHAKWASMKPVQVGASSATETDGYYADAVAAIDRRDYGRALDLLQLAGRERRDVRVLNAFAVVYDKLGRFDLSARYYEQALALEPASPLVRANLAYSQELQGHWSAPLQVAGTASKTAAPGPQPSPAASAPVAVPSPVAVATSAAWSPMTAQVAALPAPDPGSTPRPLRADRSELPASLIRVGTLVAPPPAPPAPEPAANAAPRQPPQPPSAAPPPVRIASGVGLIDAAGLGAPAQRVRRHLSALKWSAGPVVTRVGPAVARTVIRYPEARARLARALARSLPGPVTLSACLGRCDTLLIVLGADARLWRTSTSAPPSTLRRG
ncbi:tetratricopeptide repeat protein [Phenylobacterium soli]|uniref:Uncharacterized protein n=1 Tax=Phenylobacterium soli TaxID=2170551 RepID=A0A328AQW9_9CAUL|nr:hypothetical protein [Phenylobacterium soli]RAK56136.1 hypothetical protein DJ017_17260 [Phenylobacterium soli]